MTKQDFENINSLPWEDTDYWRCPECQSLNAWNWESCEQAHETDTECYVSSGSAFDNICGACGADIVEPDSPILAPCYTHSED